MIMSTPSSDDASSSVLDLETGGTMAQLVQIVSAGASPRPEMLVRALWTVGSLTLVLDISAGLYHPAVGPVFGAHKLAYYSTLASILAVVAVEMATGYCLSRASDHARLLPFAKGVLRFAILMLLLVLAVGGFALTVKA